MRNFLLSFTFLCLAQTMAQSDKNVEDGLFKINALIPGVSYELGLGKNTTLSFDAALVPGAGGGSGRETEFGIFPGFQLDFRYFMNLERKRSKGKNISGNSGNYVAVINQFYLGDPIIGDLSFSSSYYNIIGAVYGIQRTSKKGFYWGISFGPAVFIDDFDSDSGLFIDARLGWVIRKKG